MKQKSSTRAEWIRSALDRFEKPLLRYATNITGNLETAREVVQETFLRLCKAEMSKVEDHLAPWLYTVTRNQALNVRKKEARMLSLNDEQKAALVDKKTRPDVAAPRNEDHRMVLDVIRNLPEKQREACRLKFQDEMTYREISQIMGVSLGTVCNLLAEALDTIRKQLQAGANLALEV